ncbi:MAG: PAS domain S-box protein, partial [Anaerolineae bacterium]|nr:PAS domain S-box protein [Anaerolineae bacterium]
VQAQEALKESESKFRLLFEESADAMLLLDGDVFVDCNQAAVEMMRCSSKDQLLFLNPHDISPEKQPDGRLSSEKATDLIATAFEEDSLRFEWVHRTADGTDLPVEVLLTAILLHGRQVLHVVWRDITERVLAQQKLEQTLEALREWEAHLHSLLENATDFAIYRVAVDPANPYQGEVVLVSPSIRDITGISDPHRFESWFENIHPDDLPRMVEANRRAWEEGEQYDQPVRVYHLQKEQWVWVRTMSTPVFDAEGRLTHFNGLVVDITEQKRAEEALQAQVAFDDLITTISTNFINITLDEIDGAINRALQTIGEFAGVDRSCVFLFSADKAEMDCTHEWCATGIAPQIQRMQGVPISSLAWFNAKILRGETLHIPRVADLPPEASAEQAEFQQQGAQSL